MVPGNNMRGYLVVFGGTWFGLLVLDLGNRGAGSGGCLGRSWTCRNRWTGRLGGGFRNFRKRAMRILVVGG
jgi:hypothetical protein